MQEIQFENLSCYEDLGFFFARVTPDKDYPPHTHAYWEIEIILSGSANNSINGRTFPVGRGDVFVVGKGAIHEISQVDGLELYNIGFNSAALRGVGQDLMEMPGFHALFLMESPVTATLHRAFLNEEQLQEVAAILERMEAERTKCLPGFRTALMCDFSRLLLLLTRNYSQTGDPDIPWQMAAAAATLERDYAEPINLSELAASLYLSDRHFRRRFAEIYQVSPSEYLMNIRLNAAARMVCNSDRAMTDISLACGFSDSNYFSRVFRRRFSMTPTQYRKMHRFL